MRDVTMQLPMFALVVMKKQFALTLNAVSGSRDLI